MSEASNENVKKSFLLNQIYESITKQHFEWGNVCNFTDERPLSISQSSW